MTNVMEKLRARRSPLTLWHFSEWDVKYFLASNGPLAPWSVSFFAHRCGDFEVYYRMPSEVAPWPDAYVRCVARTVASAVDLILAAVDASGAWGSPARPLERLG
jgi:hypothetical protein